MSMNNDYYYLFKVVVVGDAGVGKSSFLSRLSKDEFSETYISTIGIDFVTKSLELDDNVRAKHAFWDTAGEERFRVITSAFYRGAACVMIFFDVTNRTSFDNVQYWFDLTKKSTGDGYMIVLVGSKTDLSEKQCVLHEEGKALADSLGIEYFEVSAKEGTNVMSTFRYIGTFLAESCMKKQVPAVNEGASTDVPSGADAKLLDPSASDNELLDAVGDPTTTEEYVGVIRGLFFELQEAAQKNELLREKMRRAGMRE